VNVTKTIIFALDLLDAVSEFVGVDKEDVKDAYDAVQTLSKGMDDLRDVENYLSDATSQIETAEEFISNVRMIVETWKNE